MTGKYHKVNDGWFTYYVNVETGERKFQLEPGDIEVPRKLDDFCEITPSLELASSDTAWGSRF